MSSKKNIVFFILILVVVFKIQAQHDKVKWVIYFPDIARVDKTVDILFKANIKPHCYIFSVNKKAVNHSKNTSIWFRENDSFKVVGSLESIYEIEYFNKSNNQKEYIIAVEGGFAQKIKVLKPNPIIKGQIN